MEFKKITYEVNEHIATLTMNYAPNLNAIDESMADELLAAIEIANTDTDVHVLVLKGMAKAFSAGGDIGFFYEQVNSGQAINLDNLLVKVGRISDNLKKMDKMVIAAVNGAAAGAGVSLALSADFIIASTTAKFILAFVNLGLVPDTGATYLLCKQLGEKRALMLSATGKPLLAEEAFNAGLLYEVVAPEDLDNVTDVLAKKLAAGPLHSYKNIKKQIYGAAFVDYENYLKNIEMPTQQECAGTEDFKEGVRAFMEKRKAEFGKH